MAKTSNSTSKKTAESFTLEVKDEDHYTLLSVRDIAERFGMSILTVRKLFKSGAIPKVETGGAAGPIRASVASVKRFVKDNTVIIVPDVLRG